MFERPNNGLSASKKGGGKRRKGQKENEAYNTRNSPVVAESTTTLAVIGFMSMRKGRADGIGSGGEFACFGIAILTDSYKDLRRFSLPLPIFFFTAGSSKGRRSRRSSWDGGWGMTECGDTG